MLHISSYQTLGIPPFMFFYIAAVLTAVAVAGLAAVKRNFGIREFAVIVSAGIFAFIIGGKLVVFDSTQWNYLFTHLQLPEENGKAAIGAILGLMAGLWAASKILGKTESVLNLFALALPMGLAVQGLGCLSAGCCHGQLTQVPWGVTYGPGTIAYIEQQQIGLIPLDASSSLAMHPTPIYTILACILIVCIVWKTRDHWKSPSGNFQFSIILFLAYRVAEGISTYSLSPLEWMGLNTTAWKAILLVLLSFIFVYRERKIKHPKPVLNYSRNSTRNHFKLFTVALFLVIFSLQLGDWCTSDERCLIALIILPLCGWVLHYPCFCTDEPESRPPCRDTKILLVY
jgi:prolipoprotein diacylglyceryltransferase